MPKILSVFQGTCRRSTIDTILYERDWKHSVINTFRMRVPCCRGSTYHCTGNISGCVIFLPVSMKPVPPRFVYLSLKSECFLERTICLPLYSEHQHVFWLLFHSLTLYLARVMTLNCCMPVVKVRLWRS